MAHPAKSMHAKGTTPTNLGNGSNTYPDKTAEGAPSFRVLCERVGLATITQASG